MTRLILRFRPKTVCGIIGTAVTFRALFFQGDCCITQKGRESLRAYEQGLRRLFAEAVPAQEEEPKEEVM